MDVRYPDIKVELTGMDGNAMNIIGAVTRALRNNGVKRDEIDEFIREATDGDYDNVIQTAMKWVDVS